MPKTTRNYSRQSSASGDSMLMAASITTCIKSKTSPHLLNGAVLVYSKVVVAQLGPPGAVDQNVRGLDIPMDNAVRVQIMQPIRHVQPDSHLCWIHAHRSYYETANYVMNRVLGYLLHSPRLQSSQKNPQKHRCAQATAYGRIPGYHPSMIEAKPRYYQDRACTSSRHELLEFLKAIAKSPRPSFFLHLQPASTRARPRNTSSLYDKKNPP